MVKLLLDLGVPVNSPDVGGWTALHAAASAGNTPVAELLLEHQVSDLSTGNFRLGVYSAIVEGGWLNP